MNLSGRGEFTSGHPPLKQDADPDRKNKRIAHMFNGMWSIGNRSKDELGMLEVLSKSLDVMQNTVARFKLAAYSPDVVIEIPKHASTFYEFGRARELIALGRNRAEEVLG